MEPHEGETTAGVSERLWVYITIALPTYIYIPYIEGS